MSSRRLFISDLHIEQSRTDIISGLFQFLDRNKNKCEALYILGDLFEVWIGDDAIADTEIAVASKLHDFSQHGASVFIMHGNRDFLIGDEYANRCGATIIYDNHLVKIEDENLLLLHGDTLCTDDIEYLRFRELVRNNIWQQQFLGKPITERAAYASQVRERSKLEMSSKSEYIMDVNQNAVLELFENHKPSKVLHGHTHRPAIHDLNTKSKNSMLGKVQRIVLGDWNEKGWYAELQGKTLELHSFALPNELSATNIN